MTKKVKFLLIIPIIIIVGVAVFTCIFKVDKDSAVDNDLTRVDKMNNYIQIYLENNSIETVSDVIYVLAANGITNVSAQETGNNYYWDSENNKILYVNQNKEVLNFTNYDSKNSSNWFLINFSEKELKDNYISYSELFGK